MNQYIARLKAAALENPVAAIVVGVMVVTATAKLLDANTQRSYAKTHAREVNRRIAMSNYK